MSTQTMSTQIFSCRAYNHSRIALLIATVLWGIVLWGSVFTPKVDAGTFQWGDIVGTDVTYRDVTEDNDDASSHFAPMPGTGGPIARGNSLSLSPRGFSSKSANFSADSIDSTLITEIRANQNLQLGVIKLNMLGDYALGGLIGGQAHADNGGAIFWTILEIDNVPVSLASQATNVIYGTGAGANGGQYARPGDNGAGVIWNSIATIDLTGFLNSLGISGGVTALSLTFDHTLQTSADSVSTAFIKTKVIRLDVEVQGLGTLSGNLVDGNSGASSNSSQIPEPGTALLLIAGCCWGCGCRWRQAT